MSSEQKTRVEVIELHGSAIQVREHDEATSFYIACGCLVLTRVRGNSFDTVEVIAPGFWSRAVVIPI